MQEIKSSDNSVKISYDFDSNLFEFSTAEWKLRVSTEYLEAVINGQVNTEKPFKININRDIRGENWTTVYTFQEYIPPQNEEHNVA